MCTPFTRSVYLLLDQFLEGKTTIAMHDLESTILAYDWSAELRTNRQQVRETLDYLLNEGSIRRIESGRLEITDEGVKARNVARQYADPEPAAAYS
jgi:hypothetical protein